MKVFIKSILPLLLFFNISFAQEKGNVKSEIAFEAKINDSTEVEIKVRRNQSGEIQDYFSPITTPVCKEGLCYQMIIEVYWDLLGNFSDYKVPDRFPLTKFDHEPFSEEDHIKLRKILSNKDSYLKFYTLENLVDPSAPIESEEVDGISAATHPSIQQEVVSGAVYSTFVLWHIVNGSISEKSKTYTLNQIERENLLMRFLLSDNHHYQYFALEQVVEEERNMYIPQIIRLLVEGREYVPFFAIEKLSPSDWQKEEVQTQVLQEFDLMGFEMRNEILNRLKGIRIQDDALELLASHLDRLSENQLIKVLEILSQNEGRLDKSSIEPFLTHSHPQVADMARKIINP
ncbi:hypothetical protein [Pleomorphovibrio marinus]|uniref:hypothetical protein n=1 Tax=Pleomorphovibrio marinus TaxID=2164132 RepID=UPI0013004A34|nr:hypothetical protein [Pleomorphovibrio marinus]